MSIDVTNKVWLRGPQDAKQRLLLMAIADHANEKGAAYPGLELLAQKSCQSVRNAVRGIQKLEIEGWIFVQRRKHGERARGNEYQINLARLSDEKTAELGNVSPRDTVSLRDQKRVANTAVSTPPSDKVSCREIRSKTDVDEVTKSLHEVTKQTPRSDKTAPPIENRKEPSIEPLHPPTPLQGDARADWENVNRFRQKQGKDVITWEAFVEAEKLAGQWPEDNPLADPEFAKCATARDAANLVMRRANLIGERLALVIAATLQLAVESGQLGGIGNVGELAWKNYTGYQREAGKMRYTWAPKKFFTEGHWLNPGAWPRETKVRRL